MQAGWIVLYGATIILMGGWGLYGAARLVQLFDELRDARTALGETAIGRERLRISRDLHDLLGQSLSAVSLKGELAIGLLERNRPHRAIAEIESLVSVARSALHDMRHIPHRELPISLSKEIVRATDLLSAAGIEPELDIATENLSAPVEELFGWALREGVTNVLRHSAASTCTISVRKERDAVQMVIENDGTIGPAGDGHGLNGLAQRASSLSGTARGYAVGEDHFRLEVMVSEIVQ
jgi:two-component system sensor histidine kinase DesK